MYKLEITSKKNTAVILALIILSSIFLKLYTIDFSEAEIQDTWVYVLRGIAFSNGDYAESPVKPAGYPLFLSFFFNFFDSENFVDYVNIARIICIVISSVTVFPLYYLSRHFFDKKMSLFLPILFAFQPQLNFNAGQAVSEPLFLLILIISYYFLIKKDSKYSPYISFVLLGVLLWVRTSALLFIIPFMICNYLINRDSKKLILCCILFALIISPILIVRDEQYGSPIYFPFSIGEEDEFRSVPNSFDLEWIKTTLSHLSVAFGTMSLPYLIFLFPIGIIFSLRLSKTNKNFLYNWILLIFTFVPMLLQYNFGTSARPLYHIYPFLMIFATIPIQILLENKISFLNIKQKKIILVLIIIFIILSSALIAYGIDGYGYGKKDKMKNDEVKEYSKYILDELEGGLFWSKGLSISWVSLTMIENSNGEFKNYKLDKKDTRVHDGLASYYPESLIELYPNKLNIYAKSNSNSIDTFIENSNNLNIKYLSIGDRNELIFFDDVYENEENYPYLKKIFDSKNDGFKKFKIKLFEINYKLYYELVGSNIKN